MMPELAVQSKPETICVLRLSAIGDTCHALAVIRRMQDNWPEVRISWIIGKTEASLMSDIPGIEFIIFDKSKGVRAYKDVRGQLAGKNFDTALCMHASMRANLLCRTIPAKTRLGFDKARARDFQWLFTNRRVPPADREHALEAMMSFATATGAQPRDLRWDIPLPENARKFASQFVAAEKPLVVISPCSSQRSRNYRNWSIDNYAAAIRHLQQEYRCTVLLTGGNTVIEQQYGAALSAGRGDQALNLVGKTSLKELAALVGAADLVICPDSGPAHMATAAGTAVIGLYATSNPDRTGPYLSRDLTINRYPDAAREYLGRDVDELRWGQRIRHPDAMDLITIDDVSRKIDDFFANN
ncbi:MAG: glycosyltransferase family 9 protein [Gammaproteobacteria bacterium]|nr:glycosyltransferase family 9 protein [Gammaproteobacteria bacterium]NNL45502.1 glycosyltransferase family 9 protein [Woeseiaceae bacterium]